MFTWGVHSKSGFDSGSSGLASIGALAPNKGVVLELWLQNLCVDFGHKIQIWVLTWLVHFESGFDSESS